MKCNRCQAHHYVLFLKGESKFCMKCMEREMMRYYHAQSESIICDQCHNPTEGYIYDSEKNSRYCSPICAITATGYQMILLQR